MGIYALTILLLTEVRGTKSDLKVEISDASKANILGYLAAGDRVELDDLHQVDELSNIIEKHPQAFIPTGYEVTGLTGDEKVYNGRYEFYLTVTGDVFYLNQKGIHSFVLKWNVQTWCLYIVNYRTLNYDIPKTIYVEVKASQKSHYERENMHPLRRSGRAIEQWEDYCHGKLALADGWYYVDEVEGLLESQIQVKEIELPQASPSEE